MTAINTRIERDSMGEMEVPENAYFGASTMRAVLNFPISDLRFPRGFIRSLALIKQSAAQTNVKLGLLDSAFGRAIVAAADEVIDGVLDDHFVLDIFQTGSGTSTNTNDNEVIANRATELLGGDLGDRLVHPNDHVNMCQSSNDVIPTAIHIATLGAIEADLAPALRELQVALEAKAEEFWPIVKTGRTHLQDATPVRLGQEFHGYAGQVERSLRRLEHAKAELSEVALGGTAVGTGVNAHPDFSAGVCAILTEKLGVDVRETENHFQAQNTLDSVVEASATLRTIAISLLQDRQRHPLAWLRPPRGHRRDHAAGGAAGSSIMPGKVNPVITESVIQVVAQVIGNDAAVAVAGQGGYFELNMMFPVAAYNILQSTSLLAASARNFSRQCVTGLIATTAGPDWLRRGPHARHRSRAGDRLRQGGSHRQGRGEGRPHHPRGRPGGVGPLG